MREMRKRTFSDAIDQYYKLGNNLNQRDSIAVRRTVSGLLKLLYPHGDYDKAAVERCLQYALEVRRRVKEQLKKIGGMEFFDVHFSYIDVETLEEQYVSVKEQGGGGLIPEGQAKPGTVYTVSTGATSGHLGLYRLETQATAGNGKLNTSGLGSSSGAKEGLKVAHDYFKANVNRVSTMTKAGDFDLHLHMIELHNTGPSKQMTLASFIAYCSATMKRPTQNQMIVLGDMSLGGNIIPAENMAEALQVGMDAGAKKVLLPMANAQDIPTVPAELFSKYQVSFYSDPVDAVFKALGVE
jgi:ATP-dependent Lon protease